MSDRGCQFTHGRHPCDVGEFRLRPPQLLLSLEAFGDVDSHPDQVRFPVEKESPAGEKIWDYTPILADQASLCRGLACREDLADPFRDQMLIFTGEKVQRMHHRNLFVRVAGDTFKVFVPSEEPPVMVIVVKDPGQTVDRSVRETLFPS